MFRRGPNPLLHFIHFSTHTWKLSSSGPPTQQTSWLRLRLLSTSRLSSFGGRILMLVCGPTVSCRMSDVSTHDRHFQLTRCLIIDIHLTYTSYNVITNIILFADDGCRFPLLALWRSLYSRPSDPQTISGMCERSELPVFFCDVI